MPAKPKAKDKGPISVPFPIGLRRKAEDYARRNNLQLATAIRLLVTERLAELEDDARLTHAEEWQRAQAWSTWERVRSGAVTPSPRRELDSVFDRARARRGTARKRR